jgi:hypothetical protein
MTVELVHWLVDIDFSHQVAFLTANLKVSMKFCQKLNRKSIVTVCYLTVSIVSASYGKHGQTFYLCQPQFELSLLSAVQGARNTFLFGKSTSQASTHQHSTLSSAHRH